MTEGPRGTVTARLLVIGGAMLWGTTGTTQALAPAGSTPPTVGSLRLVVGAAALLAFAALAGQLGQLGRLVAPGRRGATAAAAAAMAAYQVCFFGGVARAGVAIGTIVGIGSAPAFTGLFAYLVRGERPERAWGIATLLAVAGCALLVGTGGQTDVEPLGILLALGAGATYAAFTIASKGLLESGATPTTTMAVAFAGGALLLAPLLVTGDLTWALEPRGVVAVVWLGVATVGLAYVLFALGLSALPAATVATLTLAEPLTAGTLGTVVLGERAAGPQVLGALLVLAGLVYLSVRPLLASRQTAGVQEP